MMMHGCWGVVWDGTHVDAVGHGYTQHRIPRLDVMYLPFLVLRPPVASPSFGDLRLTIGGRRRRGVDYGRVLRWLGERRSRRRRPFEDVISTFREGIVPFSSSSSLSYLIFIVFVIAYDEIILLPHHSGGGGFDSSLPLSISR